MLRARVTSIPPMRSGSTPISWAASSTAGYTLQQSFNSGGWSQVYAGGASITSIQAATTGSCTFRVNACNTSGCNAFNTSAAVAVTLPPTGTPAISVPASSNTGSCSVGWSTVGAASMYVLQESANGAGWITVQSTGANSWSISGRGNGSYGYRVQGCNDGGCGPFSVTGTISVALVPAAPTGVAVVQYTVNSKWEGYRAQWNGVASATSYEARRTDTGASVYSGSATSFIVVEGPTPIDPDAIYDVQVRACNASGCSGWAP